MPQERGAGSCADVHSYGQTALNTFFAKCAVVQNIWYICYCLRARAFLLDGDAQSRPFKRGRCCARQTSTPAVQKSINSRDITLYTGQRRAGLSGLDSMYTESPRQRVGGGRASRRIDQVILQQMVGCSGCADRKRHREEGAAHLCMGPSSLA